MPANCLPHSFPCFPCVDLLPVYGGERVGLAGRCELRPYRQMLVESHTMSNAIKSPAIKNEVPAAGALAIKVNAEVLEFSNAARLARQLGANLGFACLLSLAQAMGESASKAGRPSPETYHSFITALTGRKLSYEQRAELARKANASVPEGGKPVAVITGKATHDRGGQTYRFNVPALTAEQLG